MRVGLGRQFDGVRKAASAGLAVILLALGASAARAQVSARSEPGYTGTTTVRPIGSTSCVGESCPNWEIALAWSRATSPDGGHGTILLGRDDDFADSLTSGPLDCAAGGPLLLTPRDGLPDGVLQEIQHHGARRVIVLGGTAAISSEVTDRLAEADYDVERIFGTTRVETAIEVARSHFPDATHAIIARAYGDERSPTRGFADALAAGAAGCVSGEPLLLTPGDRMTDSLWSYLEESSIEHVSVAGDVGAVSDAVVDDLRALGIEVERVSGPNRAGTAAAFARRYFPAAESVVVLDGYAPSSWASGLSAVHYAKDHNAPLLLTTDSTDWRSDPPPAETLSYLDRLERRTPVACDLKLRDEACFGYARRLGHQPHVPIVIDDVTAPRGVVAGRIEGEHRWMDANGCGLADHEVTTYEDGNFAFRLPDDDGDECWLELVLGLPHRDGPEPVQRSRFRIRG